MRDDNAKTNLQELRRQAEIGIMENGENLIKAIDRTLQIINDCEIENNNDVAIFVRIEGNTFLITSKYGNLEIKKEMRSVAETLARNNPSTTHIHMTSCDEGFLIENKVYPLTSNFKEIARLAVIKSEATYWAGTDALQAETLAEVKEKIIEWVSTLNNTVVRTEFSMVELFFEGEDISKTTGYSSNHLFRIEKVIEAKNGCVRIALIKRAETEDHRIMFTNSRQEQFNYIDEGRYYTDQYNGMNFFDMEMTLSEIERFNDELERSDTINLPRHISQKYCSDYVKKKELKAKLEEAQEKKKEELKDTITDVFRKKGEIKISDVLITKSGFAEYKERKIGIKGLDILSILKQKFVIEDLSEAELDFNALLENICADWELHINKETWGAEIWLGKFPVKLTRKGNCFYVNNFRINKAEVKEVLQRGICFEEYSQYETLLSEVSKCSIKIHNLLSAGLIITFYSQYGNEIWSNNIPLKLFLTREKNRHFLTLGEKRIQIKNINGLMPLQESGREKRNYAYIEKLLLQNTQINVEEVPLLLKQGLCEYREAIKRSEELLQEAITTLHIKKANVNLGNHADEKGYIVEGKLRSYFVSENLKIYTYPELKYICVIDKARADSTIGKDKLVSRLYALSNDNLIINEVHTLKK